MVIVQHFSGSVKQYVEASPFPGHSFAIPESCPHPECQATGCLIRWGTCERGARTETISYRILVQRVRCKVCGRTHSLLPDFLHPYRHYVIRLLQHVIFLYLIVGLGVGRLMKQFPGLNPARSTVREWVESFAYGTGELLLDLLFRQLLRLAPLADMPDTPPPRHLDLIRDPAKRRRLERAHRFWLLAEHLYALVKAKQPRLHFAADQFFPFMLHWLQNQAVQPRIFWSPVLSTTPTRPF